MDNVGFRLYATDDVSGPAGRARSSLLGLGSSASTVSGGLGKIGSGALTAAKNLALLAVPVVLGLGGLAIASTNAAKTFQSDMTLIQTQAGASAAEVTNMSAAVLKLAPQVGVGPEELAAGLYHVESAGLRGAKALDVLTVAAEGAKVGHADLESVTNALVAANQSGVKGVEDMSGAMGSLNAIVGAGNMRMQDLTDAMGTGVLSTAKNYGVTLQSVGAALADMTDQGIPAVDAATRLNSAMRLMAAPPSKAISERKSIGLSQTALATDMRGPGGIDAAVLDLKAHLDKSGLSLTQQAALIAAAFGGKQSGAILTLIGNVDLLGQKVDAVNQGAGQFGAAWEATGLTVAQQQAKLSASISSLKIQLGTELLPVEERVVGGLAAIAGSPAVQQGIVDLGKALNSLFSEENIGSAEKFVEGVIPAIEEFARSALPPFIAGLKVAGQITKEAFDLFNSLPAPLKAAIIGGLAVNKLSGGLIGSGVLDIIKATAGGAAGGSGAGGGVVGGLLGVQKVFVVNMGAGGMGGALPGLGGEAAAGGEAAVGGEAAAGAAGGIGLGTVALAATAVVSTAVAAYMTKQFADQTGQQQADTDKQIAAYKASQTTPEQNAAALAAEVKAYRDSTSTPWGSVLTNTFASSQMAGALGAAGDKIAGGATIDPGSIQALKDAIGVAQNMGNSDLSLKLSDDLATALRRQSQVVPPAAPAKPVSLSAADKAAINAAANTAHADVMSQLRGGLDAKKAIADGTAIAKVYGTGTVTNLQWAQKNINELTAVQKAFAAKGDVVTAAALGADITVLKDALAGKLDQVVAAVGANPLHTAPSNSQTHYAPDAVNPAGTNYGPAAPLPVNLRTNVNVSVADVNKAQNTRTYYVPGVPQ